MKDQQVVKKPIGSISKKSDPETAFKTSGRFDFRPTNIEEAIQLADIMAGTDMVPDQFKQKPGDILVAMQLGDSVGLTPMQAIQGIAVINGRPSIWGDAALAVVLASGMMENYKEMTFDEIVAAKKAVFWSKRRGIDEPIIREFSIEDAKRAGLWNNSRKPIWQGYWPRMLQMRARGFNLRDGYADVLKGLAIAEEMNDIIDVVGSEIREAPKMLAVPQRLSDKSPVNIKNGKAEVQPPPADPDPDPVREVSQPSGKIEPTCKTCGGQLKYIKAGTSKSSGKKYSAFWICDADKYSIKDADWKEELQRLNYGDSEPDPGPDIGVPTEGREPGQEG